MVLIWSKRLDQLLLRGHLSGYLSDQFPGPDPVLEGLFVSYLKGRSYQVTCKGSVSKPQRSVPVLLLFSLYTRTLGAVSSTTAVLMRCSCSAGWHLTRLHLQVHLDQTEPWSNPTPRPDHCLLYLWTFSRPITQRTLWLFIRVKVFCVQDPQWRTELKSGQQSLTFFC